MSSGMCSIFSPQMRITSTESRFRTPTKCCGTADRKSNPKAGGARFRPRADDKRLKTSPRPRPGRETIWRVPTLLAKPSPIGTSGRIQLTLCRAVVCSHWLVVDGWGALLGELCSLPVRFSAPSRSSPSTIRIPCIAGEPPKVRIIWSGGDPQGRQSGRRVRGKKKRLPRWRCAETSQTSTRRIYRFLG